MEMILSMWVPGIKLRPPVLATSTFSYPPISTAPEILILLLSLQLSSLCKLLYLSASVCSAVTLNFPGWSVCVTIYFLRVQGQGAGEVSPWVLLLLTGLHIAQNKLSYLIHSRDQSCQTDDTL